MLGDVLGDPGGCDLDKARPGCSAEPAVKIVWMQVYCGKPIYEWNIQP